MSFLNNLLFKFKTVILLKCRYIMKKKKQKTKKINDLFI